MIKLNFWPFNHKKKEVPLCINCQHCRLDRRGDSDFSTCVRNSKTETSISLTDGKTTVSTSAYITYCEIERNYRCGKYGKFFKDKRKYT